MDCDRYDYDVRQLAVGDVVELYIGPEHRWQRGTFGITTSGTAFVEIVGRVQFRFEQALLMGLRRVIVSRPLPRRRRRRLVAIDGRSAGA